MTTLSNYSREEVYLETETNPDSELTKEVTSFIKQNYQRFSIDQLIQLLNVTPDFIFNTLSKQQIENIGKKPMHTIMIIRDYENTYKEDLYATFGEST